MSYNDAGMGDTEYFCLLYAKDIAIIKILDTTALGRNNLKLYALVDETNQSRNKFNPQPVFSIS